MPSNRQHNGDPFSQTATHATAAVATQAAVANKTHFVTHVCVSSDKAGAIMLIKSGTTTIWQAQVGADDHEETFDPPLAGANNSLVSVEIDGTSACKANLLGFSQASS